MPGSSLWLLPPANHPLQPLCAELIQKTAAHFNSPHLFLPHVTLTSEINPRIYSSNPQKWLDDLPFPDGKDVVVRLGRLQSEDVFFRKLYSKVQKDGVKEVGRVSRTTVEGYGNKDGGGAEKWVDEVYMPHLSLLYHDVPKIDEEGIAEIEKIVRDNGLRLDGEGELGGWVGGRVVLVPTDKAIKEWTPVAERLF